MHALRIPVFLLPLLAAGQTPTITTLTVTPGLSAAAQRVTLAATVSPAPSTGKVMFYDGASILAVAAVVAGHAEFATSQLPSGSRFLKARYLGDAIFQGSVSTMIPYTVTPVLSYGLSQAPGSPFQAGQFPIAITVGDFNRDGIQDLVVLNNAGNNAAIFLGDGTGRFTPGPNSPISTEGSPLSIAVADFDGDGKADMAVTCFENILTVLLGDGNGGFAPAPVSHFSLGATGTPRSVSVADFNEDGIADLAVARANTDLTVLLVLLGDGTGRFTPAPGSPFGAGVGTTLTFPFVIGPASVAVADFNGDGHADVAVPNYNGEKVAIFLGDGNGGFRQSLRSLEVSGNPTSVVAADFNADGKVDLAVTRFSSGPGFDYGVLIFQGDGTGEFTATGKPVTDGGPPDSLALADFDGNGRLDLAVSNYPGSASVLLGDGRGGLSPAPWSPFDAGARTVSVAVGDFNGDGRPDLAFANHLESSLPNVSVLLAGSEGGPTVTRTELFGYVGQSSTIRVLVENRSLVPLSGPVMVVDDPGGLAIVAARGEGWHCDFSSGPKVTCTRSDGLNGFSKYPEIELTLNVTGAACQSLSPINDLLNATHVIELWVNSNRVAVSDNKLTTSISNCFAVEMRPTGPFVVGKTGSYAVTVKVAEGASLAPGFPMQVAIDAAGLRSAQSSGDGWRCSTAGPLICARNGGPPGGAGQYPVLNITGTVAGGCSGESGLASVRRSGASDVSGFASPNIFGCLTITPQTLDFGILPFEGPSHRVVTVTSSDIHTLRVSTPPGGYQHQGCDDVSLNFGQSCQIDLTVSPCFDSPNGVVTIRAEANGGQVAEYPVPVHWSTRVDQLEFDVTGATGTMLTGGQQYQVFLRMIPKPQPDDCPRNVLSAVAFDFSPRSPDPENPNFDARFHFDADLKTNPLQAGTLQAGTVKGKITLKAQSNGQDLQTKNGSNSVTLEVPSQVGVIQEVSLSDKTESSVQISVVGFSTPRETGDSAKTEVCLQFFPAPGASVEQITPLCKLKEEIRIWYERSISYESGSRFRGNITVSFTGDEAAIGGIKVVLRNGEGESVPFCVEYQSGKPRNCP